MGTLNEKLESITVRTTSPDGNIIGVANDTEVEISFIGDTFYQYEEVADIEHQLGRLLSLLAAGRLRGRLQVLDEFGFRKQSDRRPHWNPKERHFIEKRAELIAAGASVDGSVSITTEGMRGFTVSIDSVMFSEADLEYFSGEFKSAVSDLVDDFFEHISELIDDIL